MNRSNVPIVVIIVVGVLVCCLCVVAVSAGAAAFGLWNYLGISSSAMQVEPRPPFTQPQPMPAVPIEPIEPLPTRPQSSLPDSPEQPPTVAAPDVPTDTLSTLENTIVPINDLRDLARRLEGKENIPLTLEPPAAPLQVGDQQSFWVSNVDTNRNFQIDATLQYVTDHLYFWIEDGIRYSDNDLQKLANTFENEIYPRNREFFGSEWTPGVDDDPHLYVVFASGLGQSLAGYYSSADEYPPSAHEYSNAHEMFLMNADNLLLNDPYTYGVLAHEFQHMIHWYQDRNEETWLNEGFSELASFLNGYGTGGSDYVFIQDPDRQLTNWPDDGDTIPNYGAAFLFVDYFLNRFGETATQEVVASPENGLKSMDDVLAGLDANDPLTGQPIRADDVFADWVVANYLQNLSVADGRYGYANYPDAPQVTTAEQIRRCPADVATTVSQYGADYFEITCSGDYLLQFNGNPSAQLLPADPHSGSYAFWSNFGDESDMTLTREFDFSSESGPLTLTYWTWYDLEQDYDYVYLTASTDGGETWQILTTPGGTADDPSGNSYGWGYNGASGSGPRWVQEQVDLSDFAGENVLLRFEYVTDGAVNGRGFLLDDVAVPEIGYATDFEVDNGGWEAAGFARIQNVLPQTFHISVISNGRQPVVQTFTLAGGEPFEIPISVGGDVDEVVLVVSGTTRYTREPANYQFSVLPAN
ncbi:MAG: hypothetical protein ACK2UW_13435 [Anaerolineales bacterium]